MGTETLDNFFEDLKQVKATVKVKPKPKKQETPSNVYREELPEVKDSRCPVCAGELSGITHAVVNLEYASQTTLESKVEGIFSSVQLSIKPNNMGGGYWGSGKKFLVGETDDERDEDELFLYLMEWRKSLFRKPYVENLENGRRFSNLKAEHVFINVSEGTVKWIEKHSGKTWNDFLKEWNEIDVMPIPEGYAELVDKEVRLEKELKKVEDEVRDFKRGFDSYNHKERYDLENPYDIDKGTEALKELKEVLPIKIRLKNQLEDVREEIEEMLEGE